MKIDSPYTDNTPVGPQKNGPQATTATAPAAPLPDATSQNSGPGGLAGVGRRFASAETAAGAVGAASSSTSAPAANVHLSAAAAHLRAAASDSSGDIDHARVAQIKAAIANGTYRVDSSRIADGMLKNSQDLMPMPKA